MRGPTPSWVLGLLLVLAFCGPGPVLSEQPPPADSSAAESRVAAEPRVAAETVIAIEVRATGRLDPSLDIGELLALRIGEPLSREAVRETLARCHATGLFSRVELYSRPVAAEAPRVADDGSAEGGVEAILVLIGHVRVDRIVFAGETRLRTRRLRRHLRQGADGAILDRAAVKESEEALTRELHRRGYPEARVRIEERALPRDRCASETLTR